MSQSVILFEQVERKIGVSGIAADLGLHTGTIKRWIDTGNVPSQYKNDFMRLLNIAETCVSEKNEVRDKDQFYTRPHIAKHCVEVFYKVAAKLGIDLSEHIFIEPSAGCGWFADLLPKHRSIAIDIAPSKNRKDIIKTDYLQWSAPEKAKHIIIGNPPFGLRGHLALQFINHSASFADMVAFILPQLFESDGKGVPAKRVDKRLALAHSENLPTDSFIQSDGKPINISTIFQVWTKVNRHKIRKKKNSHLQKFCKNLLPV